MIEGLEYDTSMLPIRKITSEIICHISLFPWADVGEEDHKLYNMKGHSKYHII